MLLLTVRKDTEGNQRLNEVNLGVIDDYGADWPKLAQISCCIAFVGFKCMRIIYTELYAQTIFLRWEAI